MRAGVALTDGEARRHVLDLEVVEHNRLRGAIYKLTPPSGRAYIGLTRQEIAKCMTKHKASSMRGEGGAGWCPGQLRSIDERRSRNSNAVASMHTFRSPWASAAPSSEVNFFCWTAMRDHMGCV